ncbi:O-antigen ligase family protein [Polluticoccus soli]|uniref:O-antigen ligase family protein n=1 Tax=Polluticoccus soli TaxID=3034150 RepID=UPI0023E17CA9|nr:O-antigen ligase family protein [Flavipsychrobacter sp. JY13-12]
MLLLPIVVGAGTTLKRQSVENIFLAFVSGISVAALICITAATRSYLSTGDIEVLFYNKLVKPIDDIHAVYMAWYALFSLSALLFFPWGRFFVGSWRVLRFILIALQIVFFILLSSKTLIVLFFLIITPFYLRKTLKTRFGTAKVAILATAAVALFTALVVTENPIKERYNDVIQKNDLNKAFLTDYREVDESRLSNLTIRVFSWRIGIENIIDNNLWLTGCGSGDWQELQNQRFGRYHVQNWDKTYFDNTSELYNINLHNMFLQSFLMIGLPGLLLCMIIILSPFLYVRKIIYSSLFFIFHLVGFAFMMQESALQSHAGVIYYCFFTQIFWNIYYSDSMGKNMQMNISKSKKV